jgi:outer membrane lipoprotein-sorting protein
MRRLLLAAAVLPLLLAACGGGGKHSSSGGTTVQLAPTAYVKQAAAKTARAPSEHAKLDGTVTLQGQTVTMTGEGDFDNAQHQGTMQVHAKVAGVDVQIDEVLDGTNIYLRSPLLAAAIPSGKTWMKLDLAKLGRTQGADFSALLSQNPTQTFSQLQASRNVTKLGEQTIDGVDTTHYRGRLDLTKLKQLQGATAQPYDVWIGNDDGYVHRMKLGYSVNGQSMSMTMDFSDFGKGVIVAVPSQSDTFDAGAKALEQLGG